jgi:hypothetical protein
VEEMLKRKAFDESCNLSVNSNLALQSDNDSTAGQMQASAIHPGHQLTRLRSVPKKLL